jgi:hypothetical protein
MYSVDYFQRHDYRRYANEKRLVTEANHGFGAESREFAEEYRIGYTKFIYSLTLDSGISSA